MPFIKGFGAYLPARVVPNEEVAAWIGCEPGWIYTSSGIHERRFAAPDELVADMGMRAAADCLSRCSANASQIGLLIAATGSAEQRFPSPGADIAHRLGMAGVPVIDLPMASAGSLFGIAMASQLSALYGEVLVVAAEKMSAAVAAPPVDRNTALLFGDGAGAVLVSPNSGRIALQNTCLHSDGSYGKYLRLPLQGPLEMDGPVVIMQSCRKIPAVIREALGGASLTPSAVRCFIMHQANRNLITRVAQALGVPVERFYSNIGRYGNTSSASMLIAAAEWFDAATLSPGEAVVFAGFGAGFHWGAVVGKVV